MNRVLITGASGLLGHSLSVELQNRGCELLLFDYQTPKNFSHHSGLEFVQGDVRNLSQLRRATQGVDTVFHLAAVMHAGRYNRRLVKSVNISGVKNVLIAASEAGVRRLVFSSTIELYGTSPPLPCSEEAPANPPPGYAEHKWRGECFCRDFMRDTDMEIAITRMPMIFGPGFYHQKTILGVFEAVRLGLPLYVMDGGHSRGMIVGLDDAVQGLILAATHAHAPGRAFNICGPDVFSHREFVESLIRNAGSRSRILNVPSALLKPAFRLVSSLGLSPIAPEHFEFLFHDCIYDITRARDMIGYDPKTGYADALFQTYVSYLNNRRSALNRKNASEIVK